jgi:hypothetical protein
MDPHWIPSLWHRSVEPLTFQYAGHGIIGTARNVEVMPSQYFVHIAQVFLRIGLMCGAGDARKIVIFCTCF